MFEAHEVIGVFRVGPKMVCVPGLDLGEGTLVGVLHFWPLRMQPQTVEVAAAVAFLVSDPQDVYYTCDTVHGYLLGLVSDSRTRRELSPDHTTRDDVALANAAVARGRLLEIASTRGLNVTALATLGSTQLDLGTRRHTNHFYRLQGEPLHPLIAAAMNYDRERVA